MSRIHFLVDEHDKLRWEAQAAREGLSLGAWLREAAEVRYASAREAGPFDDPADLEAFFARCDDRERTAEPDWDEHRALLDASLRSDGSPT